MSRIEEGKGYIDGFGKEVAKGIRVQGKKMGLFNQAYKKLMLLAESLQRVKPLWNSVSVEVLADLIFDWVMSRYQKNTDLTMIEYVLAECEREIKEIEIWVPISNLLIESEFTIGKVSFKTVTKPLLDAYLPRDEEKIRKDLQGYAAASMKLTAEPKRAHQIVFEEAEKALLLLLFFSPVNFEPTRISHCTFLGKSHLETINYLIVQNQAIIDYSWSIADMSSPVWQLDTSYISDLKEWGLDKLGELFAKEDRTDLQEELLGSVFQYSKNCLTKDAADKLVHILVGLESIVLKDSNEPIMNNIGERMAALIGQDPASRKAIIANVKKTYALRSSFVHHGQTISIADMDTIKEFMHKAWSCLHSLVLLAHQNATMTKAQFFDWIEERRLSY